MMNLVYMSDHTQIWEKNSRGGGGAETFECPRLIAVFV